MSRSTVTPGDDHARAAAAAAAATEHMALASQAHHTQAAPGGVGGDGGGHGYNTMDFVEIRGRLDELLRGAGFPPDSLVSQQLENGDVVVRTAEQYAQHQQQQLQSLIEYRHPTAADFQPGRAEHHAAFSPPGMSQSSRVSTPMQQLQQQQQQQQHQQPWTQAGPSRPQSAVGYHALPPAVNQKQPEAPSPASSHSVQTPPFQQHRSYNSVGALNPGQSAPVYVANRLNRSATLSGQAALPESHLRFRNTPDSVGSLPVIAEAEGSVPVQMSVTPDDAASKHQATMYRGHPAPMQDQMLPRQMLDNNGHAIINNTTTTTTTSQQQQPFWNMNPAQPIFDPSAGHRAPFHPTHQVASPFNSTAQTTMPRPPPQQPGFQQPGLPQPGLLQPGPPQQPVERRPLNPRPTEFRPMQAVLDPTLREQLSQEMALASAEDEGVRGKFSSRYYGMHTEGNASADHLTNEQNCALWLRNLPPDVTHKELLQAIRGIGRIWCTYINLPDFVQHNTAAAKVAFFAPSAARRFLAHIESAGPTIRGFRIKADYNRIKYPEKPMAGGLSRVLIVTGASWFVNPASLCKYFAELFTFQVDEVITLVEMDGRAVVEFRFGSYRCQAQMGKMALERQRPEGLEMVEFGEDPCETGETFISYRLAAHRISKKALDA